MFKFLWGFAVGFIACPCPAPAEELLYDLRQGAYCSIYAREQARIDIMHTRPVTIEMAQSDYPIALAVTIFKQCISVLPTMLPLSPEHRELDTWAADMQILIRSQLGTEPAGEGDGVNTRQGSSEWVEQCRREYRSFNEADGTVVRRGSHSRVRCPCGDDVSCG